MSQNDKVSVIIPNYNYANYVGQAIASVQNQTYENIEVIVVNNGSTDSSLEVLRKYNNKICLVDQENLGQSGARNAGLARATGSYIAFLDADDYWEPDKIERQLRLIRKDTQLIYSGLRVFENTSGATIRIDSPRFSGDCSQLCLDYPTVAVVLGGESTALVTRELIKKVGVFDVRLSSASGWDFFRRCSKETHFDYVDDALSNYRIHDRNMSLAIVNSIPETRLAYELLFSDKKWSISRHQEATVRHKLELLFIKTALKERKFKLVWKSLWKWLTWKSRSSRGVQTH